MNVAIELILIHGLHLCEGLDPYIRLLAQQLLL
jgi:hypothetical protein